MSFAVKDEMEKLLRTGYYRPGYMLEDDGIMILNREHKTLLNVWSDAKNGMEIDKDIKNSFARLAFSTISSILKRSEIYDRDALNINGSAMHRHSQMNLIVEAISVDSFCC